MRKVIDHLKGHPIITGIIGVAIGVAAIVFVPDCMQRSRILHPLEEGRQNDRF